MTDVATARTFCGIGVSGDPAMGVIHLLADRGQRIDPARMPATTRADLDAALREADAQLEALIERQDRMAADILEFQQALLGDQDLLAPIYAVIGNGASATQAWIDGIDAEIEQYREGGDSQLAARADDLADLCERVLRILAGDEPKPDEIASDAIVVGRQISPSRFLDLDIARLAGVVSLGGSPTSHVSLLARAKGVPMIVGIDAEPGEIGAGHNAIMETRDGRLTVDPDEALLARFRERQQAAARLRARAGETLERPAQTRDGESVTVYMNVDHPDILDAFSASICDGVGLTRTEFLFGDRADTSEQQQYEFYRRLVAWAGGRPVTIRSLDAGGDKPIAGFGPVDENNSFLGLRGIRLSLREPEIFLRQLRAIARAAALGPIRLMVPMVTVPEELEQVRRLLDDAIVALQKEGEACRKPALGMMVEVPSAALRAHEFDADFYSLGSNDLLQYVTAAARDNAAVANLADPASPALLRLVEMTVAAARIRNREVSICGDLASSPEHLPALLATGIRSLSCAPAQIGYVKLALSEIRTGAKNKPRDA